MIKLENISKSFGDIKALNDVSLEIEKGEIFGLLGPNGAGKSTSINIISTVLKADEGETLIDGEKLSEKPSSCKMKIGVVPQEISLYENLTAYENLYFWGELYNIDKKLLKDEIDKTLQLVGLYDRKDSLVSEYSGGMKRRINIAASLLHKPKVLLMDEPTVGIDPQSRNRIFEVVEQLNKEGMTIIYTTHYMEEAERLCDRIAIIDLGKIVATGTLQELKEIGNASDILTINTDKSTKELEKNFQIPKVQDMQFVDHKIIIQCKNISSDISRIISEFHNQNIHITGIESKTASLETVFLNLTGKQLRD